MSVREPASRTTAYFQDGDITERSAWDRSVVEAGW
jgi:hypothetical protein